MKSSRLDTVLRTARNHPWYRDTHTGHELDLWPVLTKSDLYSRLGATRENADSACGVYYSRSGGTNSDRPLFFPTDIGENHLQRRRLARHLRADGVFTPQTIALNILPIVRMYRAMEIFNELCERCGATVLPMAALAEDDELFDQARLFQANTLVGMPTRILALARFLQQKKINLTFDTVVFGGEFLQIGKRHLIQESMRVRRFCALYGSAELGVVAWNADIGEVPIYRFPRDILHIEIANPDSEGFGPILATNVVRRRFPIIRYRTGDVGRLVAEDGQIVTVELRGRDADSFQIGDNYHSLGDFAEALAPFSEFQIQIRFEEALKQDVIRFCLVPGSDPLAEQNKECIKRQIRELLQAHEKMYRVEIDFVPTTDLIQKGSARKTPLIIDSRGR